MAAVPTGTLFSVATTFGSTITVTAVTNANPAVCTATAHGLSNGDIIEFTSGWGRANKRVFRVANQATNTFELEGFDTSSTSFFPAGTGIGTVREVTAWTQLTKVMNPATQGGDPKTVTYKFVESDVEYSINDGFTATSYTLEFDDDDTTSGYTAMRTLTDAQTNAITKTANALEQVIEATLWARPRVTVSVTSVVITLLARRNNPQRT